MRRNRATSAVTLATAVVLTAAQAYVSGDGGFPHRRVRTDGLASAKEAP